MPLFEGGDDPGLGGRGQHRDGGFESRPGRFRRPFGNRGQSGHDTDRADLFTHTRAPLASSSDPTECDRQFRMSAPAAAECHCDEKWSWREYPPGRGGVATLPLRLPGSVTALTVISVSWVREAGNPFLTAHHAATPAA
ncbi:hypothetical protein REA19_23850 [Prescottella equi]|nr:hypothetical protein REA19_23850 [Prescottella equi]